MRVTLTTHSAHGPFFWLQFWSCVISLSRDITRATNKNPMATDLTARRDSRVGAVKILNEIATSVGVEGVLTRASASKVQALYEKLCVHVSGDDIAKLAAARDQWTDNGGGGDLPLDMLPDLHTDMNDEDVQSTDMLPGHRVLQQSLYDATKAFRLKARAFMLTFNSRMFTVSLALWDTFAAWVKQKAAEFGASEWSATLEESLHADEDGKAHLHAYFSWSKPGQNGVDHRTTNGWVFSGIRPRVDVNSENRGRHMWMKSVQHGHFYVSVQKKGTAYTDTNYPPWEAGWAPEPWWITKLWRVHKLDHAQYRHLSTQLREGHDKRKACVDAVEVSKSASAFQAEREVVKRFLSAKALPFKPLHPDVERWKMQYEEIEERFKMLVLYGPSRTGKSRLARSFFGEERTLVVDFQHAEHPDLRAYRRNRHRAILLDEVSSVSFIAANKKLLQAHVDGAILGQSATQLFSYYVFLWRVPIVLTTNNWDLGDLKDHEKEWVLANCIPVFVGEPVWEKEALPGDKTPPPSSDALDQPGASEQVSKRRLLSCHACGQRLP